MVDIWDMPRREGHIYILAGVSSSPHVPKSMVSLDKPASAPAQSCRAIDLIAESGRVWFNRFRLKICFSRFWIVL